MNKLAGNNKDINPRATFKKAERLCSKKVIDKLFTEGKSIFVHPVKMVYLETQIQSDYPVQVAITVPKRNFKKAVQRNLIKRRLREAYRLNKSKFYKGLGEKQVALFFIYSGKSACEYREIEKAIIKGLNKLALEIKGGN
jgi:ribonuclease P protein component